ncbi:methyl-accepting chemotaxis protein [Devosia sp.]|uniref:methyl-accepting chemotaxis protein n=1 Tax=Devosia sp. TaxID=1871048 RepID=UPI003265ABAA
MVKFSLAKKLPTAIVAVAIMVGAGIGASGYFIASQTAGDITYTRLAAMASDRSALLEEYLNSRKLSVLTASRSETVQNAIRDLHFGWIKLGEGPAAQLQKAYSAGEPTARADLADSGSGSNYDGAHARFHQTLHGLQQAGGFEDLYLFDADGNCIYSVNKGDDFAASFAPNADLGKSQLGAVVAQAATSPDVQMSDVAGYAPIGGAPGAFMASVVQDKRGQIVGAIAVRLSVPALGALVNGRSGLGESGEVVIVGADHKLRNNSAFTDADDTLTGEIVDPVVDQALSGTAGSARLHAYRDQEMLVEAIPLTYGTVKWAILTMIGTKEAMQPVQVMGQMMLASAAALLLLAAVIAYLLSRTVAGPISRLTAAMGVLARGELEHDVPHSDRADEIGDMARAVEVFRENGLKVASMTDAEAARIVREAEERSAMMAELQRAFGQVVDAAIAGDFSRRVTTSFPDAELNALASSINNLVEMVDRGLGETAEVLAALADTDLTQHMQGDYEGAFARLKTDTNAVVDKLTNIVRQLKNTSTSLKTATGEILSGANDLSDRTSRQAATIKETSNAMGLLAQAVTQNASRAREASSAASGVTRTAEEGGEVMAQANAAMERITTSSEKISNIIGLIDDIAFQTNLLALNASVEAARAGDAGKGFAVVAVEVRRLAQSAASASTEVKALIQQSAVEVSGGSKLVADAAGKLKAMMAAARSSNDLMDGIARDSREQATSIDEINTAVRQLDEMTQHNAALVEETNAAIEQTEAQASELDRVVDIFTLEGVRRAEPQRRYGT